MRRDYWSFREFCFKCKQQLSASLSVVWGSHLIPKDIYHINAQKHGDLPQWLLFGALVSAMMKCLKRLVVAWIICCLRNHQNWLHFAHRHNRRFQQWMDAISLVLHSALNYLDNRNTCQAAIHQLQLVFNTIIPSKLKDQAPRLGPCISLCKEILDFLISRP